MRSSWWDIHQQQQHGNYNDQHDEENSIDSTSFHLKNNDNNPNVKSSSNQDDDDSFSMSSTTTATASNHSSYHHSLPHTTNRSSVADDLFRQHNHLWNPPFLPNGSLGDAQMIHSQPIISSRDSSARSELFEPPYNYNDYLNKTNIGHGHGHGHGHGWSYETNQVRYGDLNHDQDQSEHGLSKLSDLVGKYWSIAPPNPDMDQQNISLYRQTLEDSGCSGLETKLLCSNQLGLSGTHNDLTGSFQTEESSRRFHDIIRLNRPIMLPDINPSFKPRLKALSLSEFNKEELKIASPLQESKKKKRFEKKCNETTKKAKCDGSSFSPPPPPPQPPKELSKGKVREKISTLQQIVSPFGKTDTASVLEEAIANIKFLQEQVKLLSTPYMKNSLKDPWRGWDREGNKREIKYTDLKSRGLSLVPLSSTPFAYRDDPETDYWSPTFRGGSFYR